MKTNYLNPWHRPGRPEYGPKHYSTTAKPKLYRGYLIINRISGKPGCGVWDVVKDGKCITQMAGPNGAMHAIDQIIQSAGRTGG